jgi:hypothetical protein
MNLIDSTFQYIPGVTSPMNGEDLKVRPSDSIPRRSARVEMIGICERAMKRWLNDVISQDGFADTS